MVGTVPIVSRLIWCVGEGSAGPACRTVTEGRGDARRVRPNLGSVNRLGIGFLVAGCILSSVGDHSSHH